MSHEVLTPPEEEAAQPSAGRLDHTNLLPIGAEGSIWESLVSNLRDTFRPQKLPPLELTSTPVPVVDPLAVKRSPRSSAISTGVHALIILLVILLILFAKKQPQVKQAIVTPIYIAPYLPKTPQITAPAAGGGGGGAHEITPPTRGKLPQISNKQITPPQVLKVDHPKIPIPPTIVMPKMKVPDSNFPNLGLPQAQQVTLSAGNGGGSGIGSGHHGGIGSGDGAGLGPGGDGGTGGGVFHPGGGISNPVVIYSVDPEFSDEARRQKYQGVVVISLIVDTHGNPQDIRVVRPLGMGLDEKAVEAVRQYRFKPAMRNGKPVAVEVNIEVNFQLF
jgi:TonB family protein